MAVVIEKAVAEDLNTGYGTVTVTQPSGSATGNKIGIHTLMGTAYLNPADQAGADFGAQVNAAVAALPSSGGVIDARGMSGTLSAASTITLSKHVVLLLPIGTITLSGSPGISVTATAVAIIGAGQNNTLLKYAPSGTGTAIQWSNGATVITQGCLRGFSLDATGNSQLKTGILVNDAEEMEISDVAIANWSDGSKSSIGIHLYGRQTFQISRITANCDLPFQISLDPNTSAVAADHFHFSDIYTIADASQPHFKIDDGVWLTNCTWDGYQAWAGGLHGMYWNDLTGTSESYALKIENVRWEQSVNANGYALYLSPNHASTALNVRNIYTDGRKTVSDPYHKGFFIRNFYSGEFSACRYAGTSEAINVDSTVGITIQDNYFNLAAAASVSATGFGGTWRNNDNSGGGTAAPRLGLAVANPTNDIALRNNKFLAGLNLSGVEKRLIGVDSTNGHLQLDADSISAFFSSTVCAKGDRATNGNPFVAPNNQWYAADADGTNLTPKGGWKLDTSGRLIFGEDTTKDAVFNTSVLRLGGTSANQITRGAGNPNGVVTGSPGDLYLNTSGGAGTSLYVKESGVGTTANWVAK